MGFPGGSDGKESVCNEEDPGSMLGPGRFLGEGSDYPHQHFWLENPTDRAAWQATVHGVAEEKYSFTSLEMKKWRPGMR